MGSLIMSHDRLLCFKEKANRSMQGLTAHVQVESAVHDPQLLLSWSTGCQVSQFSAAVSPAAHTQLSHCGQLTDHAMHPAAAL